MGDFTFIGCQFNTQIYIMLKGYFLFLPLVIFTIHLSSSQRFTQRRRLARSGDCSKCGDFKGNPNYNCGERCEICSLCRARLVPLEGCNYCAGSFATCKGNCNSGLSICKTNG